ncbi:hypothetical protein EVAR_76942_1 [Eumeta japonica]|uniref:Uncharacterized protein n=1 Tax=Eumeta variegata TaxID=151549 RepID=A0A4C1SET7_EUMVA|nr:hypothetical protein EVAR_76942_1 [Eumeta japonica]
MRQKIAHDVFSGRTGGFAASGVSDAGAGDACGGARTATNIFSAVNNFFADSPLVNQLKGIMYGNGPARPGIILAKYRREIASSAVTFCPVSKSSGGPLSSPSSHFPFHPAPFPLHQPNPLSIRYPIPIQEASNVPTRQTSGAGGEPGPPDDCARADGRAAPPPDR